MTRTCSGCASATPSDSPNLGDAANTARRDTAASRAADVPRVLMVMISMDVSGEVEPGSAGAGEGCGVDVTPGVIGASATRMPSSDPGSRIPARRIESPIADTPSRSVEARASTIARSVAVVVVAFARDASAGPGAGGGGGGGGAGGGGGNVDVARGVGSPRGAV